MGNNIGNKGTSDEQILKETEARTSALGCLPYLRKGLLPCTRNTSCEEHRTKLSHAG